MQDSFLSEMNICKSQYSCVSCQSYPWDPSIWLTESQISVFDAVEFTSLIRFFSSPQPCSKIDPSIRNIVFHLSCILFSLEFLLSFKNSVNLNSAPLLTTFSCCEVLRNYKNIHFHSVCAMKLCLLEITTKQLLRSFETESDTQLFKTDCFCEDVEHGY